MAKLAAPGERPKVISHDISRENIKSLVGAGFGGCAIAVAEHDFDDGALAVIASRYKILAERDGRVFAVTPGEGASVRRVSA